MTLRPPYKAIGDDGAAVAAMYALALFGLIGMAGVAMDYGRLMTMESELQNAADQAALAAATQLDGREGATVRARDAAIDFLATADSDYVNLTRMANDEAGRPITGITFRFFASYDSATDSFGTEITNDDDGEDANVVLAIVNGREAFYALTPVVGAFSSGNIGADAVAGMQTATCNVPPLMFCAPSGSNSYPDAGDVGKALRLHMRSQSAKDADVWAPGNFGFLNINYSDTPSGSPNTTMGWNSDFLGCAGEEINTRPGFRTTEASALNTRFDLPTQGGGNPTCDADGNFCPSDNVRSNYVRVESHNNVRPQDIASLACDPSHSGTMTAIEDLPAATRPADQGLPPDSCMLSGGCTAFGDGVWSAADYMSTRHNGTPTSAVTDIDGNGSISRYEVYEWERASSSRTNPRQVGTVSTLRNNGRYNVELYCSYPRPIENSPRPASPTQKDRRLLTVASVDCNGLNGSAAINVIRWVDLFLITPSDRTDATDRAFITEIVGPAKTPGGGSGFQYYGRNKPVLLR